MKKCWEIKNCSAARFESSCNAFKSKKHCWEVEDTMCMVNHGNDICEKCEVYATSDDNGICFYHDDVG